VWSQSGRLAHLRGVLRPRAAAAPVVQQSVDLSISWLPGLQQQTRSTRLQQANGRQTDGHRTVSYTLLRMLCRQCQKVGNPGEVVGNIYPAGMRCCG